MKYATAVAVALLLYSTEVRAQAACKPAADSSNLTYTRVLIPVLASHLPGAAGSIWQTDVWITNPTDQPVVYGFNPCNIACCCTEINTICPQTTRLEGGIQPEGRWIGAPVGGLLRFEVRLRDLTRNASSAGVELPIVREDEFVSDEVHLLGVPRDPKFRITLRFYGLDSSPVLSVDHIDQSGNVVRNDIVLLGRPSIQYGYLVAPGYAQLSIDPSAQAATPLRIRIKSLSTGIRFWAFASVTNNDTSEVTLILPAR
jgi:hypothetical protein